MKLSPEQIGTIEALLTLRERGVTNAEIGRRLGIEKFGQQKVSCAFAVLEAMGFDFPKLGKGNHKFRRAAMASEQSKAAKPKAKRAKVERGPRVFLSADQWQERLSALGH